MPMWNRRRRRNQLKAQTVKIDLITADDGNLTRGNIETLAADIKDVGLLQPLVVVEGDKGYFLKAGHRRLKALQLLKRKLARCTVFSAEEFSSMDPERITLSENLQREDLTPLQECEIFAQLKAKEYDDESIAQFAGKTRTYVRARLALADASKRVRISLRSSEIELGHALLLSQLPTKKEQDEVLEMLIREDAQEEVSVASLRHHLSQERWDRSRQVFVCRRMCKHCVPHKLSLFHDQDEPSFCTSDEHLSEEKKLYIERVEKWGKEAPVTIDNVAEGEYFDTHGLNLLSGEPPWDLPEDTEKLMLQNTWHGFGFYIIPMAQKTVREDGVTKKVRRSIEVAKGTVAVQVAAQYTTDQVTAYAMVLLRKEPLRLLLWTLLEHYAYNSRRHFKEMFEDVELPTFDAYHFCSTAEIGDVEAMLAHFLAHTASRASTATKSSMLEGIAGLKVQDDFRTTPEHLKLFTKAELLEIPKKVVDFKGMKKDQMLDELTSLNLSQVVWPELREELKARVTK